MKVLQSNIYHFIGTKPGPITVVMGSVHGNERMGAKIIEALNRLLLDEQICGEVFLIIGNPQAYKKDVRFIDIDLNRLFGDDFNSISRKKTESLLIEEQRALEIAPILAKADYLLDIHSTIKKSIPFIYVENTPEHIRLANIFDVEYIVSSLPSCKAKSLHSSTDNFVDNNGGIGITYETGWHKDDSKFANVLIKTKQFLSIAGSAFRTITVKAEPTKTKNLFIYEEIVPKRKNFIFEKNYKNFDFLKKGDMFAIDGNKSIIAENDSYIIFPKKDIIVGKTACYLAKNNSTI